MARCSGWSSTALVLLACCACQWLVHAAIVETPSAPVRLALMLAPLLAAACWIATRARRKALWLLVLLAAGGGIFLLEARAGRGLAAAYGLPHAAMYLLLLWFFSRTLAPGNEPLITRLARRVHGSLPPAMQSYTRRLTIAWCWFFGAQVAVSVFLGAFATVGAWSAFVNLLNLPLLALMFLVEYGYRVTRHRDFPHASLRQSVEAFMHDTAVSKSVQPR
jgi:uncharacterized membrane protein